jgi:hypothetical protein
LWQAVGRLASELMGEREGSERGGRATTQCLCAFSSPWRASLWLAAVHMITVRCGIIPREMAKGTLEKIRMNLSPPPSRTIGEGSFGQIPCSQRTRAVTTIPSSHIGPLIPHKVVVGRRWCSSKIASRVEFFTLGSRKGHLPCTIGGARVNHLKLRLERRAS